MSDEKNDDDERLIRASNRFLQEMLHADGVLTLVLKARRRDSHGCNHATVYISPELPTQQARAALAELAIAAQDIGDHLETEGVDIMFPATEDKPS